MTDYVIRREGGGVHLVINGLAFRHHEVRVTRGFGEPPVITVGSRTIKLKLGDTLRYEGWDVPAEPSPAEVASGPTRLEHVAIGQHLPADDLRRLAFDLYRLEHGGAWQGDVLTAHRVNIAVDWWNGDAREFES